MYIAYLHHPIYFFIIYFLFIYFQNSRYKVGAKLSDLPAGDRMGVLVDDKRQLHLYVNGQDQGVAAPDVPDPCWPYFELYGPYRQVGGG
jgi:hypothetical protein